MPAEIENLILKQLAALREDMQDGFTSVRTEIAELKETVRSLARADVAIQRSLAAMQRDMVVLKDRINILTVAVAGDDDPHTHA
jgi:hypothetical protein